MIESVCDAVSRARQSFVLLEELYRRQYVNLKDTESKTAKDIIEKNALVKEKIYANLLVVISKLVGFHRGWSSVDQQSDAG